jgi:hypothetical protein
MKSIVWALGAVCVLAGGCATTSAASSLWSQRESVSARVLRVEREGGRPVRASLEVTPLHSAAIHVPVHIEDGRLVSRGFEATLEKGAPVQVYYRQDVPAPLRNEWAPGDVIELDVRGEDGFVDPVRPAAS